jgi:tRNA (cmo5U34)-methyltransferase
MQKFYSKAGRCILTNDSLVSSAIQNGNGCSLGHFPGPHWEFDEAVAKVFDDMLARSIPQIAPMREVVARFGGALIQPKTDVVDLGCACGDSLSGFIAGHETSNRFVGIDRSRPMLMEASRRFQELIDARRMELREMDLRVEYPDVRASLTLCILTLQFVPIELRYRVLSQARAHTVDGGGLILVEKILGADPVTDRLLVDVYYMHKRAMGYSQQEIDSKRRALEGVLVPVTASWNEAMLLNTGFRHIECIWRCMNFCGWVAIA